MICCPNSGRRYRGILGPPRGRADRLLESAVQCYSERGQTRQLPEDQTSLPVHCTRTKENCSSQPSAACHRVYHFSEQNATLFYSNVVKNPRFIHVFSSIFHGKYSKSCGKNGCFTSFCRFFPLICPFPFFLFRHFDDFPVISPC